MCDRHDQICLCSLYIHNSPERFVEGICRKDDECVIPDVALCPHPLHSRGQSLTCGSSCRAGGLFWSQRPGPFFCRWMQAGKERSAEALNIR
eukprot:s421_g39.t1